MTEATENRDKIKKVMRKVILEADLGLPIEKETAVEAFDKCYGTRGTYKDWLKKTEPADPHAKAIWLALVSNANPYKIQVGSILMLGDDERKIFDAINTICERIPQLIGWIDKDRTALSAMGVW